MIAHLYNNYGSITTVKMIKNEKRIDNDPSGAIETYFGHIEDAMEFTEAGNSPYTTTHIVMKVFIQMFITKGSAEVNHYRYNGSLLRIL